jgi:serine/threonine-protein kinase HipA
MTDRAVLVYADLDGVPHLTGRLWTRMRRNRESASFECDPAWLRNPARFSLQPALAVGPGAFHTAPDPALFGALGDSVPDRWGRALMRRKSQRQAEHESGPFGTLREIDYLLQVDDQARQGALRFADQAGGPFLSHHETPRIPPLVDLPRLLQATDRVLDDRETDDDLRLLLAPGSSLGGARPKASVRLGDHRLAIAKFPRHDDEINVVLWESVALVLARKSGIAVPPARVERVAARPVLLVTRFDRDGPRRVPFLSAMSMLGATDLESRTYMEFVDALRQHGAEPRQDMEALWRRIVFNVLISNTDDHLRNHAFLYDGPRGWRLSPAYDLNPVPVDIRPRVLATRITEDDNTASLELALSAAGYFEVRDRRATEIVAEVASAVSRWRREASSQGLAKGEIDRMASAFEHRDMSAARSR